MLRDFEKFKLKKKKKKNRCITIDNELDTELKKIKNLNISELINQFLWFNLKRKKKKGKKTNVGNNS